MPEPNSPVEWLGGVTSEKEALTISSGDVTVTKNFAVIAAESGTADDLDGITPSLEAPGDADGFVFCWRPDAGDTITLRHNQYPGLAKNILVPTGENVVLTNTEYMVMVYDVDLDTNGAFVPVAWGKLPQEVDWQAVFQLDDTATGNNKGRWKVSLPDDAGTVTVFKFRAVNGLDANTNVSADMVFDVNLNGVSQGTVTIPSASASGDADVVDFTIADGDRITIDKDSGPDEGSVHQVVLIGKRQLKVSIAS